MSVGLIVHLDNPTLADIRALAAEAEMAGVDWLGVPDAFWWRDTWVLGAEALRATQRLQVGPLVTNPYLRHPFHTVAAIATLQELAGDRVLVGLGAGGSELSGAARISRIDAPALTEELATLIRRVAAGALLDDASGRSLEVPLVAPRIIVGGRGPRMLSTAGRVADDALLWAVPRSELERTVGLVAGGAGDRPAGLPPVNLIWAPLAEHDPASRDLLRRAAAYAVLNNRAEVRQRWGVSAASVARVRHLLVAGDTAAAENEVPGSVLEDLRTDDDVHAAGAVAAKIGATGIAVAITDLNSIGDRVSWARRVLAAAGNTQPAGTPA
jgi:5,10-methylenetetrahydromethanopterin reductase